MKTMRTIPLILATSMVAVTITGCRAHRGEDGDDPTKANITVATLDKGIGTQWLYNAAAEFEELYKDATNFQEGRTGVKIHVSGSTQYDGNYIKNSNLNKDIYFTEGIPYHEVVKDGKLEDITSVVNADLSKYGDSRTIKDKIDEQFMNYLTIDGKVYGVPFYDAFYGMVYDMDLWNERSLYLAKNGSFTNKSGDLSLGTDNIAGTLDDGLPATYAEFAKLVKAIRDRGMRPFINSSNGIEYTANYLYNVFADYEGVYNMNLNLVLNGTAKDLIEVDDNGNITQLPEMAINEDNAYYLKKQAGLYKTLRFLNDILLETKENYRTEATHTQAQSTFVNAKEISDPVAMIMESSWWENEARSAIDSYEKKYKKRTNYAIMPIPFENAEKAAACGYKHTYLSLSQSFGVVSKSSQNKELAFEFMKFLHSDKMLSKFTRDTSITRPLNYEVSEEDQASLTTYAKSLIDLKKTANVVYPYSNNQLIIDNNDRFNAFNWTWNSRIDGVLYRHPWMYFVTSNPSVKAYFDGQFTYFRDSWSSLVRK